MSWFARPSTPPRPCVHLGTVDGRLLSDAGLRPLLGVGPTGCGKTSGLAYPTLAHGWTHAAVVWDYKGVMAADTAALRARFGPVLVLDLARRGGARYNPLMAIRPGDFLVQDAQHVARILCETERPTFWDRAALSYLVGVIVHVLTAEPPPSRTLAGVRAFVVSGDAGAVRMLAPGSHPTARRAAAELWSAHPPDGADAGTADGETRARGLSMRQGVYTTASVLLAEFEAPILAAQTAESDFRVSDLVCGERPLTLYLTARPMDARQLRQVYKLVLTQLIDRLTVDRAAGDDGRPRRWSLLFLLDEFLQFRLPDVADWIKYVREYRIRPLLLAQSLWEVEAQYGEGLVNNCPLVAFRPEAAGEAERLSRLVGTAEAEVETVSVTRRRWFEPASVTRGHRRDRRPVLPPHAVQEMDPDTVLVFGYGKPIRGRRIRYWEERPWTRIARAPPPPPAWTRPAGANPWLGPPDPPGAPPQAPADPSAATPPGPDAAAAPARSLRQIGV